MKHPKYLRLTSILTLLLISSQAFAAGGDFCVEERAKFVRDFNGKNLLAERTKAYGAWKARAWHAAALASRRWTLIRQAVLNTEDGRKAKELMDLCNSPSIAGTCADQKERAKEHLGAAVRSIGDLPVTMECPKGSAPDERYRDMGDDEVFRGKPLEAFAQKLSKTERVQFQARYQASHLELSESEPLLSIYAKEAEKKGQQFNGLELRRATGTVSWCKTDHEAGKVSEDIRFPLTWSRPSFDFERYIWHEDGKFEIMAGDTRFATKDPNGNVRPPVDLASEGYFVYAQRTLSQFLTLEPPTPHEILDTMVPPPRLTGPTEAEIAAGVPGICSGLKKDPPPVPEKAVTDTNDRSVWPPRMIQFDDPDDTRHRKPAPVTGPDGALPI